VRFLEGAGERFSGSRNAEADWCALCRSCGNNPARPAHERRRQSDCGVGGLLHLLSPAVRQTAEHSEEHSERAVPALAAVPPLASQTRGFGSSWCD